MSTPVLLEVQDLHTRFDTPDGTVRAVDGVTFKVRRGEAIGLVGESGSGKSVTALSILGLIPRPPGRIERGAILFENRDLIGISATEMRRIRARHIAMVFQDPMTSLNPILTIGRQLTEAMETHLGLGAGDARQRAIELLEHVGIPSADQRLGQYPHQFSGGMRQRVMIAMAISCNPQLLIADEPTTALDVTVQAQIVDLVKRLRRELNMAIVWITHDLGIVAGLCDRVIVMYAGRIVEDAPVKRLFANPAHPYTRGLLASIPRLDGRHKSRLQAITGLPPDLIRPIQGCAFAPRCPYAQEICRQRPPELRPVGPEHTAACWFDLEPATDDPITTERLNAADDGNGRPSSVQTQEMSHG